MPRAVRPRPITAPAVIMAPQIARMTFPPMGFVGDSALPLPRKAPLYQRPLEIEQPQKAAANEQHARRDDEEAAATAAWPDAVGPRRPKVGACPAEKAARAE